MKESKNKCYKCGSGRQRNLISTCDEKFICIRCNKSLLIPYSKPSYRYLNKQQIKIVNRERDKKYLCEWCGKQEKIIPQGLCPKCCRFLIMKHFNEEI